MTDLTRISSARRWLTILSQVAVVGWLGSAHAANAEIALTVNIQELVVLDAGFDDDSAGDFSFRMFAVDPSDAAPSPICTNQSGPAPAAPYPLFTLGGAENCETGGPASATWLDLEQNHPDLLKALYSEEGARIGIRVLEHDSGQSFQTADADPDPGDEAIDLFVTLGGAWSGDFTSPGRCNWGPSRPWEELTQTERDALPLGGRRVRICWSVDVNFPDADGDGLLDVWETEGLDVDFDGVVDLDLPAMGADPDHKDLFVEIDYQPGAEPGAEAVRRVQEAFARAPPRAGGVANPDEIPGIRLWMDTGGLRDPETDQPVGDDLGGGNRLSATAKICDLSDDFFYDVKRVNFDTARRLAFRYVIYALPCCLRGPFEDDFCPIPAPPQGCNATDCARGGKGELGGNDVVIWENRFRFQAPELSGLDSDGRALFEGATLMHELGHTLNLAHGGDPSYACGDRHPITGEFPQANCAVRQSDPNCEPNYVSIMNYNYPKGIDRVDGTQQLDYSPALLDDDSRAQAPLSDMNEGDLDENLILDPGDAEHYLFYSVNGQRQPPARLDAPVDWDGDGVPGETGIVANVDESFSTCRNLLTGSTPDGRPFHLTGHDDWRNLGLAVHQFADSANAPVNRVETPETGAEDALFALRSSKVADLAVELDGPLQPLEAEVLVELGHQIDVSNSGPNPVPAELAVTLPTGFSLTSAPEDCQAASGGVLRCDLGPVDPGAAIPVQVSFEGTVACSGGVPQQLSTMAAVANAADFAGPDPDPSNNTAIVTVEVADTQPPEIACNSPGEITPPDAPISFAATASDACDAGAVAEVTAAECFTFTKKGRRVDKSRSCEFAVAGDTLTILDSGGVGDHIAWTVRAVDIAGNEATTECEVEVTKPREE